HPSRRAFVDSYRFWHSSTPDGKLHSPEDKPAIPLPLRMQVERGQLGVLDVTVVGDFRPRSHRAASMVSEVGALAERGLTVGVMHLEDPTYPTGRKDPLAA